MGQWLLINERRYETVLGPSHNFGGIAVAYDDTGYQLNIDVHATEPVPAEIANAVRRRVLEFYDRPVRVRLIAQISADAIGEN